MKTRTGIVLALFAILVSLGSSTSNSKDDLCGKTEFGMLSISSECPSSKQLIHMNQTDFKMRIVHEGNWNPDLSGQSILVDIRGCKLEFKTTKSRSLTLVGNPKEKLTPAISIDVNGSIISATSWNNKAIKLNCSSIAPFNSTEGTNVSVTFSEPFVGIKVQIEPFESTELETVIKVDRQCSNGTQCSGKKEVTEDEYKRFWHSVPRYVWIIVGVIVICAFVIPAIVMCSWCICPCILFCCVSTDNESSETPKTTYFHAVSP
jgi:hypothetical protein